MTQSPVSRRFCAVKERAPMPRSAVWPSQKTDDRRHRGRVGFTVAVDRADRTNRCSGREDGRVDERVRRHGLLSARRARRGERRIESSRALTQRVVGIRRPGHA